MDDSRDTNEGVTHLHNINKIKARTDRRYTNNGLTQLHNINKIIC